MKKPILCKSLSALALKQIMLTHCTRLCHASSVAALLENIGSGAVTASFSQCQYSDAIIVIGANPTVDHPVAATFIKNAAQKGLIYSSLIRVDRLLIGMPKHL